MLDDFLELQHQRSAPSSFAARCLLATGSSRAGRFMSVSIARSSGCDSRPIRQPPPARFSDVGVEPTLPLPADRPILLTDNTSERLTHRGVLSTALRGGFLRAA